jgi:hypothetical protein
MSLIATGIIALAGLLFVVGAIGGLVWIVVRALSHD